MKSTKNYDLFKFREDNRARINTNHVKKILNSIKNKNMLQWRPIIVNEQMEVLDGQHRLVAAKELGVEIFYEIKKDSSSEDIISLNVSQSWGLNDYLNYYIKNGYEEYIKLNKFLAEKNLGIIAAINITSSWTKQDKIKFKEGTYKFCFDDRANTYDICVATIDKIKKYNGYSVFCKSSRFWKALLLMVNHREFNSEKWFRNMDKFIERFVPKASSKDYLAQFISIHNHGNHNKILISPDQYFTDRDEKIEEKLENNDESKKSKSKKARQESLFSEDQSLAS